MYTLTSDIFYLLR